LLRDIGILCDGTVALWRPVTEKQHSIVECGSRTVRNVDATNTYSVIRQILSDRRAKFWYSTIAWRLLLVLKLKHVSLKLYNTATQKLATICHSRLTKDTEIQITWRVTVTGD
jgi:hypothetical protein